MNEFIDRLHPDKKHYSVYIIDSVHRKTGLRERLQPADGDLVLEFDASSHEPKTSDVDGLRDEIFKRKGGELPRVVAGIGGGSTLGRGQGCFRHADQPGILG